MFDELKKQLKLIFETNEYDTHINEDEEPTNDFIYTGANGVAYTIKVEPDENEFNVFDKSGKQVDIFVPTMVDQDGGLPKDVRKAIMDDYNQNHSQPEEVAENAGSCELKVVNGCAQPNKEGKVDVSPMEENKEVLGKFEKEYGKEHGKAAYYATANKQGRDPETFHKMKEDCDKDPSAVNGCNVVKEENKINKFPLEENKKK